MSIYFISDLEGRFTRKRDFTWRVSDCEELVGLLTGDDEGWFRRIQNISSIGGFESESSN